MPGESIKFVGDFTELRNQLDRVVADASRMRIAIPVGSAPGAAGAIAAGFPPTVSGVFGSNFADASGRFSGGFEGRGFAPLGGNFNSFPSTAGFGEGRPVFNYTAAPTVAGTLATPTAAGGPPGGFPAPSVATAGGFPVSGSRFLGLRTSGLARYVGAGFLAHEALRFGEAGRDYASAMSLAGSDQEAALRAEQGYYKSVAGIPLIGQAASLIADPTGSREAGIEATINSAHAQDRRTNFTRDEAERRQRASEDADAAGITDPVERQISAARTRMLRDRRAITSRAYSASDLDREELDGERATLESDRPGRANRAALDRNGKFYTGNYRADYQSAFDAFTIDDDNAIATSRTQKAMARARSFEPEYRAVERRAAGEISDILRRDELRTRVGSILSAGELSALGSEAANDPRAAARSRLLAHSQADVTEALSEGDLTRIGNIIRLVQSLAKGASSMDTLNAGFHREDVARSISLDTTAAVTSLALSRNPLASRLAEIEGERLAANEHPNADTVRNDRNARLARGLAIERYADERGQRLDSLRGEGRVLDAEAKYATDRQYGPLAGVVAGMRERMYNEIEQLRAQDPEGNAAAIGQVRANYEKRMGALTARVKADRDSYMENFHAVEVSRGNLQGIAGGQRTFDSYKVEKMLRDPSVMFADVIAGVDTARRKQWGQDAAADARSGFSFGVSNAKGGGDMARLAEDAIKELQQINRKLDGTFGVR